MKPLLMVRNVEKTYGKGANKYKALDHISFEIDARLAAVTLNFPSSGATN